MTQLNDIKLATQWFNHAENALGYAKTGLPDTSFYGWICFLCHQSAELYLKGLLTLLHVEPPKTHDLTKLLELCRERDSSLESLLSACTFLNRYYIAARYSPDVESVTKEKTEQAIRFASDIESAVVKLRKEGI